MTSAPIVMFGQATEMTPMAIARSPRHTREEDTEENMEGPLSRSRASEADRQVVFDGDDAGGGPGDGHGGVVLVPRAHGPGESHPAVVGSHRDVVCFDLGGSLERLLDRMLDVGRVLRRLGEVDVVLDAGDTDDVAGEELRLVPLVLRVGTAAERDKALLNGGVDRGGHERVEHEGLQYVPAHLRVVAALLVEETDVKLVIDVDHPSHPLG